MAFQGMWSVGQCPSGGKDGSATKKNLVSRLLIHVQFSLTTHFYDIWTVTDRAHFENCCVNDSLWFDKSCRDTGSCVASIVLLRLFAWLSALGLDVLDSLTCCIGCWYVLV